MSGKRKVDWGGEGVPSLEAMASFPSSTQTAAGTGRGLLLKHWWLQAAGEGWRGEGLMVWPWPGQAPASAILLGEPRPASREADCCKPSSSSSQQRAGPSQPSCQGAGGSLTSRDLSCPGPPSLPWQPLPLLPPLLPPEEAPGQSRAQMGYCSSLPPLGGASHPPRRPPPSPRLQGLLLP